MPAAKSRLKKTKGVLLSADAVAVRLGCSLSSVYRLVKSGRLPNAERFGLGKGVLLIPEADVRAYEAKQYRPAAAV